MKRKFRVAVMGCGPGGSYLYRLLSKNKPDLDISLFDRPHETACGAKPCAWGVDRPQFTFLCRLAGMDEGKFILGVYGHITAGRMKVRADIAIIDKPLFLSDMMGNAQPSDPLAADISAYDRVIDATGVRAYLPPTQKEAYVDTVQIKAVSNYVTCPVALPRIDAGYSWLFPAGTGQVHLGSLSATGIAAATKQLLKAKQDFTMESTLCSCTGHIWRGGPVLPFVDGKVWGLGESIGLVDPVPGAGIIPAMNSARMMVEHWDEPARYQKAVLQAYAYMSKEARIVASLAGGKRPALSDLLLPPKAYFNIGVYPTFRQVGYAVMTASGLNRKSVRRL